ncbi:hypothetical protein RRG08_015112 [Elysia crispata]|uniref:Uncharacterized protein n=1 Tax=Elysia crispata TaxID=231223 RepID=A0AAE1DH77_9GAST|nr:hypothetical protein RRG08_015112 [Elysia crispata]
MMRLTNFVKTLATITIIEDTILTLLGNSRRSEPTDIMDLIPRSLLVQRLLFILAWTLIAAVLEQEAPEMSNYDTRMDPTEERMALRRLIPCTACFFEEKHPLLPGVRYRRRPNGHGLFTCENSHLFLVPVLGERRHPAMLGQVDPVDKIFFTDKVYTGLT